LGFAAEKLQIMLIEVVSDMYVMALICI